MNRLSLVLASICTGYIGSVRVSTGITIASPPMPNFPEDGVQCCKLSTPWRRDRSCSSRIIQLMQPRKIITSGTMLAGANAASALCSFLRNVVLARLLTVEDFGVAAALGMGLALAEAVSNFGVDRLIVQSRSGDSARTLANAHAFSIARGIVASLAIYFSAGFGSAALGVPHVAWAFQVLAIIPLVKGLVHLDAVRMHRHLRFGPTAFLDTGSQILSCLAAIPVGIGLGDYRAMLALMVVQALFATTMSHVVAERRYRVRLDRAVVRRFVSFGWPLLLNALLMFAVLHGEKMIVGANLSVEALGLFAAATSLTLMASDLVLRTLNTLSLPTLSRSQASPEQFQLMAQYVSRGYLASATFVGLCFVLLGPSILVTLFGNDYSAGGPLVVALGVMQCARIAKGGIGVVSMAKGNTFIPLLANLTRCSSLILAVALVYTGGSVLGVALVGLAGELVGCVVGFILVRTWLRVLVLPIWECTAAIFLLSSSALLVAKSPTTGAVFVVVGALGAAVYALLQRHEPIVVPHPDDVATGRT